MPWICGESFEQAEQDPFQEMPIHDRTPVRPDLAGKVVEEIKGEWVQACLAFDEAQGREYTCPGIRPLPD